MYGPILSVLLMGMIPVSGMETDALILTSAMRIAPPAFPSDALPTAHLSASGAIVIDRESGQVIFDRRSTEPRPMASLTKLMTALLITEHHDLSEWVTISKSIEQVPSNGIPLPPGDQFTVGDLLSALLIQSSNDAAVALAYFHSGSMEKFAEEMNERARSLGLQDTSYQNAAGLDAPLQRSSPQDLAWLAMFVMRRPEIAQRMASASGHIRSRQGVTLTLTTTHALLRADDPSVFAGKTGTTDAAGQCLLSVVEANGRQYIAVLLHSKDRYADMRTILAALTQQ